MEGRRAGRAGGEASRSPIPGAWSESVQARQGAGKHPLPPPPALLMQPLHAGPASRRQGCISWTTQQLTTPGSEYIQQPAWAPPGKEGLVSSVRQDRVREVRARDSGNPARAAWASARQGRWRRRTTPMAQSPAPRLPSQSSRTRSECSSCLPGASPSGAGAGPLPCHARRLLPAHVGFHAAAVGAPMPEAPAWNT